MVHRAEVAVEDRCIKRHGPVLSGAGVSVIPIYSKWFTIASATVAKIGGWRKFSGWNEISRWRRSALTPRDSPCD
jgi:hypothetical protein